MTASGPADVPSAATAARSIAAALGLTVDQAIVLHASNRVTLRLLPCDVLARVALATHEAAQLEVELATQLARTGSPVAVLDPRVAPRVYEGEGFRTTFWTYYEARPSDELSPAAYALALSRLHAGMRQVELTTPHFMDRVTEAESIVANAERTPEFTEADAELLTTTFASATRTIRERRAPEQLLHGEPHPGNVLNAKAGPLFIDLETGCRGPIEFDLAHVPGKVSRRYPDIDAPLLRQCRILVLAMVAAWRLDPGDRLPHGREALPELLAALRAGPPYPALGTITGLQ